MRGAVAFVLAATLAAHGAGLRNGFVYDDHRFVVGNAALATASVPALLLDPATQTTDTDRDVYRPLRAMGHAFDLRRWGLEPFGFHLHSLLAHLACVLAGYGCLRCVLGDRPALLGATVLGVHPLGAEAVGWISSRGDLYALLFGLLAVWAASAADESESRRPRHILLAASALSASLAVLGKESAAWVPLVVTCRAWLLSPRRRCWTAGATATLLGVLAALALRQIALAGLSPVQTAPHGGSWAAQAGWALNGLGRTLSHCVWPLGLSVDYPQQAWGSGGQGWWSTPTALAVAVLAASIGLCLARPPVGFALVWMLLAYLPSSSLLVTLRSLVTDRAAYPALLPAGALVGIACARRPPAVAGFAAAILALLLVPLCVQRTREFENDARLWSAELARNPASVQARLGLASVAVDSATAERQLREAVLAARPGSRSQAVALARLGDLLLRRRSAPAAAVPLLERALEIQRRTRDRAQPGPEEAETAGSLAEALTRLGRDEDAEAVLRLAIVEQPRRTGLHVMRAALALWRWEHGHGDEALLRTARDSAATAAALAPDDAVVRALLRRLDQAGR